MFTQLEQINRRPRPFEHYTARELWTDPHISSRMLAYHLDEAVDVASRRAAFIDRSVAWISGRFDVGARTRIADFGCGPGLYALRLARQGARVTGIDFSTRSLGHAEEAASREGLSIDYVARDYLTYEPRGRYQLVLMIMCDFCALGPEQRRTMLRKFHAMLERGGSVLLDAYSLTGFARREETARYEENLLDGFWAPGRYFGFLNTFKYEDEQVVLDKYTIIERARTRTIYNWLQHFSPEALQGELSAAGFELDGLFADVAGSTFDPDSTELAVVATRR